MTEYESYYIGWSVAIPVKYEYGPEGTTSLVTIPKGTVPFSQGGGYVWWYKRA